jgi:hypothetical protein
VSKWLTIKICWIKKNALSANYVLKYVPVISWGSIQIMRCILLMKENPSAYNVVKGEDRNETK